MLNVNRRHFLLTAGGVLLLSASDQLRSPAQAQPLRIGMVLLEVPAEMESVSPPTGWDWAGTGPGDVRLLVKGSTIFPTPELAMARVLAPDSQGRIPWEVIGDPPQPVQGAQDYLVVDIVSRPTSRTGTLVCATRGSRTAVIHVSGPRGWSPALRRGVLSSIQVSDEE